MAWLHGGLALVVAAAVAAALVSGGSSTDPRTPAGPPGLPPPLLGVGLVGGGGATAAVDAYGDVVDLRASPAGAALLAISPRRLQAGTADPGAAIVPVAELPGGRKLPFWEADSTWQRYRAGSDVLVTKARFGSVVAAISWVATDDSVACLTAGGGAAVALRPADSVDPNDVTAVAGGGAPIRCDDPSARHALRRTLGDDRRWLARALPLGDGAPAWARPMYRRSLLVLRGLTSRRGAVAAGARYGWAYVWPRDASAAALAFTAAGYRDDAKRVTRFLLGLDLEAAARFDGAGEPVPGRVAQGDAAGWVLAAAKASGLPPSPQQTARLRRYRWRDRADYQEKAPGDYLGNALAAGATASGPIAGTWLPQSAPRSRTLGRQAGRPGAGVDSAAAWAVRPFAQPVLFAAARRSLRQLLAAGGRFGIVPSGDWPEPDPWTAPTAWSAWAFAILAREDRRRGEPVLGRSDRAAALRLLADLRRAATPAGDLPERVDATSGLPRSTTPLAWSHAFTILALHELWPGRP